ncbi:8985_t:CDS:2 [Cetraspora pellucida]|uniref:8985_t:CDS:1 n=1 Tax=Cetraspora pellucida TaxID=1433469 RepID=A0ACA9K635_9GLOM|nr:8985_t:CDS:2 [Cetraspora pellucida]
MYSIIEIGYVPVEDIELALVNNPELENIGFELEDPELQGLKSEGSELEDSESESSELEGSESEDSELKSNSEPIENRYTTVQKEKWKATSVEPSEIENVDVEFQKITDINNNKKPNSDSYQIACKSRILDNWYSANELEPLVALTTPLVTRQNGLTLYDLEKPLFCSITLSPYRGPQDPLNVVPVEEGVECAKNKPANCTKEYDDARCFDIHLLADP